MALPLAIIMIVLLGVMGAGLLTFVSRDLNTVVEQNRGQRAFELADAGVGVAKRQLTSDCAGNTTCIEHYDANMLDGAIQDDTPDIQWSWINGGVTLNDLDDNVTTVDSVNVTIDYLSDADSFRVISEGTYGNARRKIQAIFKGIQGAASGGGDGLGHPLYYTPSDIKIAKQVELNRMSLFSEQDILLEDNAYDGGADGWEDDRGVFRTDLRFRDQGTTKMAGDVDELCDWNTTTHYFAEKQGANQECFKDITGTWNTQGRLLNGLNSLYPHLADQIKQGKTKMEEGGLAAEGLVCGVPTSAFATTNSCDPATTDSVADGVYAYDCTTGPVRLSHCTSQAPSRGNNFSFVDKEQMADEGLLSVGAVENPNLETNPAGTISFPFPRPTPIPKNLAEKAAESEYCGADATNKIVCSYTAVGAPTQATWQQFWPDSSENLEKIVFVDAQNQAINFSISNDASTVYKGILVVWCGDLVQQQSFNGVILNLRGNGFTYEAPDGTTVQTSSCGLEKGRYTNDGYVGGSTASDKTVMCRCWVYAQGGDGTGAGVVMENGSKATYPTNRTWSFLNDAFETDSPPPRSLSFRAGENSTNDTSTLTTAITNRTILPRA